MNFSYNTNIASSRLQWLAGLTACLEPTEDGKYLRKASRNAQITDRRSIYDQLTKT